MRVPTCGASEPTYSNEAGGRRAYTPAFSALVSLSPAAAISITRSTGWHDCLRTVAEIDMTGNLDSALKMIEVKVNAKRVRF